MNIDKAWQQILSRDPSATFYYGVRSTRIFCRPLCPSRRPQRENVQLFSSTGEARAAGFRACLRCQPENRQIEAEQIHRLCKHLQQNIDRKVTLAELGRLAGASPFTVQRLFRRVLGTTAVQYQRELRAAELKQNLHNANLGIKPKAVTEAIYQSGYGSSSRVYEDSRLGMSPRQYQQGGKGEAIGFASAPCELGWILVAETERGICSVLLGDSADKLRLELQQQFPSATITEEPSLKSRIGEVLAICKERSLAKELPLDIRGTAFQQRVWEALKKIPSGQTRSYSELAEALGTPQAVRAVANACAQNKLALLIPCHRVIGRNGKLTGYRWGVARKEKLLAMEGHGQKDER